jgi:hypothetical protein
MHYACKKHKLERNLQSFDEIMNNLENSLTQINDIDFDILKFYKTFEDCVSEYIINLLVMKVEIKEPFIKVKINSKIIQIIKEYEKCFDNRNCYDLLLIQKIVDNMLETNIHLYGTLIDFNSILNYEPYWKEELQKYCIKNDKICIDKESIFLNLETTENFYNLLKNTNYLNE